MKRKDLDYIAATVGLYVRTWSPGDGATRYRFIARDVDGEGDAVTYFGASDIAVVETVTGRAAAERFLLAFKAGYSRGSRLGYRAGYQEGLTS